MFLLLTDIYHVRHSSMYGEDTNMSKDPDLKAYIV